MNATSLILEQFATLRGQPLPARSRAFHEVLQAMPDDALRPSAEQLQAVRAGNADDHQLLRLWEAWGTYLDGHQTMGRRLLEEMSRALFYLPEPHLLVGFAALLDNRRDEAIRAFRRGIRVAPEFPVFYDLLRRFGLRQAPVLPFFARDHRLNLWLGRLRARLQRGAPLSGQGA